LGSPSCARRSSWPRSTATEARRMDMVPLKQRRPGPRLPLRPCARDAGMTCDTSRRGVALSAANLQFRGPRRRRGRVRDDVHSLACGLMLPARAACWL
jgi:hypothetical protein